MVMLDPMSAKAGGVFERDDALLQWRKHAVCAPT